MKKKILAVLMAAALAVTPAGTGTVAAYADGQLHTVQNVQEQTADVNGDTDEEVDENCVMGSSEDTERLMRSVPTGYDQVTHADKFTDFAKRKGIDVSRHNGNIDWNKVKADGVEFAIVRVAYRSYQGTGKVYIDEDGMKNIRNAKKAGIKVGAYIYSQATTIAEAIEEADFIVKKLENEPLELPVVLDYEFFSKEKVGECGRLHDAKLTKDEGTAVANAFCAEVAKSGYMPMVYANANMLNNHLNAEQIYNNYPIWLANYTNKVKKYSGSYTMWQFTSTGAVDGISGAVDLDYWYDNGVDMGYGFSGLRKMTDGSWKLYENGVFNPYYTGLIKHTDGRWYFLYQGVIDFGAKGLAKTTDGSWRYVEKGVAVDGYTGLQYNGSQWFYVHNGVVDWNYTGFVKHTDGKWYYVKGGVIDFGATGLRLHTDGNRYYSQKGIINFGFKGLAKGDDGYWRNVKNGCAIEGFNGLVKNGSQWFYVKNGTIDWSYSGFAKHTDGNWYYVKNSVINFGANGLRLHSDGNRYYTKSGVIRFGFKGLAKGDDGYWRNVKNGCAIKDFNGLVKNGSQWFYVKNGTIDWSYSGFVKHTDGNWYYVKNSVVNFSAAGLKLHSDGNYYYAKNGIIRWGYYGTAQTPEGVTMNVEHGLGIK